MGVMRYFYFLLAMIIPCSLWSMYYPQRNYPFSQRASPISLNTLTLLPCTDNDQFNKFISMADLAEQIHTNFQSIVDGTRVLIRPKNNDGSQAKEYSIYKKVMLEENTSYVTVFSRGFARESMPVSKTVDNEFSYKKIIKYLFPSFHMQGLQRKGGGFVSASVAFRDQLIHTPCITFDYPDTRTFVDFAQSNDLKCLTTVMNAIPQEVKIISMGVSRGATASLKYALTAEKYGARQASALILESPFISIENVTYQLSEKCFYSIPGSLNFLQIAFNLFYPRYKFCNDNLLDLLMQNNQGQNKMSMPILITHLQNDPYISDKAMFGMVQLLSKHNDKIYLLVLADDTHKVSHGRLHAVEVYQQVVNAFLHNNGLACNKGLAQKGQVLLERAKKNAGVTHHEDWTLTECFSK